MWICISVCSWWHGGTWGAGREAGWEGRFGSCVVDRSARGISDRSTESRRSRSVEVEQPPIDGLVAHVEGPSPTQRKPGPGFEAHLPRGIIRTPNRPYTVQRQVKHNTGNESVKKKTLKNPYLFVFCHTIALCPNASTLLAARLER